MKKCDSDRLFSVLSVLLLLLANGLLINAALPPKSSPSPQSNSQTRTTEDEFWRSMERTSRHLNDHYSAIANDIAQISAQINSTPSTCYQLIEGVFRAGVSQQWSAKCEKKTVIFNILFVDFTKKNLPNFVFKWQ